MTELPIIARQGAVLTLGSFEENLRHFSDWTSTIDATIGFDTASFTLHGTKLYLEDWFTNGLGRRIQRYEPKGGFSIWEGFVNKMTLVEPGTRSSLSLDGIVNKDRAKYVLVDPTTTPPTISATATQTANGQDTDSQARYGIHEGVISVGETTAALATQKRDQHLQRLAWPQADDSFDTQQTDDLRIEVECKGFAHTLAWQIYNQTVNSGTVNIDAMISAILTAAGQFIATPYVLDTNTAQVPQYIQDDRFALDILKALVSLGDASNNRWVMPVLEERIFYYRQARTTVDYFRRVSDSRQTVRNISGRELPPWEVRPDHWLRTTDIFPFTMGDPSSLQRDPQVRYIESVTWSEPNGLAMFGSQKYQTENLLAAGALPGVGVI